MSGINRLDERQVAALHAEVVCLASALFRRSLPLLAGVRALSSLSHTLEAEVDDPDFSLFVAIDSETDHLPNAEARAVSSSTWLEQCDRELADVERVHGAAITAACERLLFRYAAAV